MNLSEQIIAPKFRNKESNFIHERKATWTELFYDLGFVVALRILSQSLELNINIENIIKFIILFTALWWAWSGYTFYNDRFDSEDLIQKITSLLQMFAIAGLALFSNINLDTYFVGFAIFYIFIRIVLIASYIRVYLNIPEARDLTVRYAFGFSLALVPWLIGILGPAELRIPLILVALIIDFGTPISQSKRQSDLPLNISHLPERFGLFVLLVLGEIILGIITSLTNHTPGVREIILVMASIFITFTIWWLYFETLNGNILKKLRLASQIWFYVHLPLTISITLISITLSQLIVSNNQNITVVLNLSFVSFAAALFCLNVIEYLRTSKDENLKEERIDLIIRTIAAAISILLIFGNFTSAFVGVWAITVLSAVVLGIDILKFKL